MTKAKAKTKSKTKRFRWTRIDEDVYEDGRARVETQTLAADIQGGAVILYREVHSFDDSTRETLWRTDAINTSMVFVPGCSVAQLKAKEAQ